MFLLAPIDPLRAKQMLAPGHAGRRSSVRQSLQIVG